MDIVKAGIGLTKTIRNVGRLREIVLIFARHGFDEFISSGVTSRIPNFVIPRSRKSIKDEINERIDKEWSEIIGYRLRQCLEELGPAFIKFGQLLSTRDDLFESGFLEEMKLLRDKVRPIPFTEVEKSVEQSLGQPIHSLFERVENDPIGTASIGVVYRAKLLTGEDVVLKVRRPNIAKEISTDFSILLFLAQQTEKVSEEIKYLGVTRIVSDFAISLQNELNFNIEAHNCDRLRSNIQRHDKRNIFSIPKVYKQYSSETLIVMDEVKGTPFTNIQKLAPQLEEIRPKLVYGVDVFIKTFLVDGFFHADLHGGNFFYKEDGSIGLIDFGLMGSLSRKSRKSFIAIIYSIVSYNYENLVYEFLEVAEYEQIPDVEKLVQDVRDGLSPFVGLTIQQTNFSLVLTTVIQTLKKHHIFLPREWFIVFRSLITLDGVGKTVGVDLDIFSHFEKDIEGILKETLSKDELLEDAIWSGRDMLSAARVIPRHLRWYLKEWSRRGYAHHLVHSGHESSFHLLYQGLIFLGVCILAGVFIYSGAMFIGQKSVTHWTHVPIMSWIFWVLAFLLLGFATLRLIVRRFQAH
jgi:ubiquinone biosynthesis protein